MKTYYLVYSCGKEMEISVPLAKINNGQNEFLFPHQEGYFELAKEKFENSETKVVEKERNNDYTIDGSSFVSIIKRPR